MINAEVSLVKTLYSMNIIIKRAMVSERQSNAVDHCFAVPISNNILENTVSFSWGISSLILLMLHNSEFS